MENIVINMHIPSFVIRGVTVHLFVMKHLVQGFWFCVGVGEKIDSYMHRDEDDSESIHKRQKSILSSS